MGRRRHRTRPSSIDLDVWPHIWSVSEPCKNMGAHHRVRRVQPYALYHTLDIHRGTNLRRTPRRVPIRSRPGEFQNTPEMRISALPPHLKLVTIQRFAPWKHPALRCCKIRSYTVPRAWAAPAEGSLPTGTPISAPRVHA